MLNIFVCDDEKSTLEQINNYIIGYFINYPGEYKINLFSSGMDLYIKAKQRIADVIFLDIELQDGNGIKIAKEIRKFDKQVKIIFITSHTNYKGAAFSVRAFGYVDKPVTPEKISFQLKDIEKYLKDENKATVQKFETQDGLINLPISDIIYFVNENRKIKIVTFSENYYMKGKISVLEKQLHQFYFKSPHSSFLVNLDYVTDIKNYIVYMVDNIEIPLSQRKSSEFRLSMDTFLSHSIALCKGEYDD